MGRVRNDVGDGGRGDEELVEASVSGSEFGGEGVADGAAAANVTRESDGQGAGERQSYDTARVAGAASGGVEGEVRENSAPRNEGRFFEFDASGGQASGFPGEGAELFEDEDGDVANEFLVEGPGGFGCVVGMV